ncbi:MAG: toprim domain-containing protein [Rhodobacteraceae bacterium]|nr:toprim domain-containing protein [Paracoccaceae bacterium]
MTDAQQITSNLGGHWKNGRGSAPCPICQIERLRDQAALSISEQAGTLLLHCFKSNYRFADLAHAVDLSLESLQIDFTAREQAQRKQADCQAAKLANARALWEAARPIIGTKADSYLRGRYITCYLPTSLRFISNLYHAPSATWTCAMVADVSTGGVHRTFFNKQRLRLRASAKMMLGPCAGGAVVLSEAQGPLLVCEGIETGLALLSGLLIGPATLWASLSTSGMKTLQLPQEPGILIIATDGDQPGKLAGNSLATRATALGWQVSMLPAPDGKDWADVLVAKRCGA